MTAPMRGYSVAVRVRGRSLRAWRGVATYGSWAAALAAARAQRDAWLLLRDPSDRLVARAPSGERGVWQRRATGMWYAGWTDGRRHAVACGRGAEGEARARALRLEADRRLAAGQSTADLVPTRAARRQVEIAEQTAAHDRLAAREAELVAAIAAATAELRSVRAQLRAHRRATRRVGQADVLALLAAGRSVADIAAACGVSRGAVYAHVSRARRRHR